MNVTLRFYAELNDLIPRHCRGKEFQVRLAEKRSVKDLVESLGAPHTEIDLILANGRPVDFDYIVEEGDRISVYPVFESLNIRNATHLRQVPLRKTRFIADTDLGNTVRTLRMLGFDVLFDPGLSNREIIEISGREQRIILTKSRSLLKFKDVTHGICLRPGTAEEQAAYVVDRLDIRDRAKPFSRCIPCNGLLQKVDREAVLDRIPAKTRERCDEYLLCGNCGRLYWNGTHTVRMRETADRILGSPR